MTFSANIIRDHITYLAIFSMTCITRRNTQVLESKYTGRARIMC